MVTSVVKNKLPLINVQHLDRERIAGQMNAVAIARNVDAYGCNGCREEELQRFESAASSLVIYSFSWSTTFNGVGLKNLLGRSLPPQVTDGEGDGQAGQHIRESDSSVHQPRPA